MTKLDGPPNLRTVNCCEFCRFADHGYEGEIDCELHPTWVGGKKIHDNYITQGNICDDFKKEDYSGEAHWPT